MEMNHYGLLDPEIPYEYLNKGRLGSLYNSPSRKA